MKLLDLTLPSPAENVALDEALLDAAEADAGQGEVLRLWEPPIATEGIPYSGHFVVAGRSTKIEVEVDLAACRRRGVSVLRRSSGGAAIVAGPGCLMYAVVLSYERRPQLRMLDQAHVYVLSKVAEAVGRLGLEVHPRGTSDLVWGERKISGNSLRCKRDHFVYHGTLLYDFDLPLIGELLRSPPRQPQYRGGRSHGEFLANLPASAGELRHAIAEVFGASEPLGEWPRERTLDLAAGRYGREEWNLRGK